jgi:hypothetical protein
MRMKLKAELLEKLINESLSGLKNGFHDNESFAIHEKDGMQVQIMLTKDEYEMHDNILPEYEQGE